MGPKNTGLSNVSQLWFPSLFCNPLSFLLCLPNCNTYHSSFLSLQCPAVFSLLSSLVLLIPVSSAAPHKAMFTSPTSQVRGNTQFGQLGDKNRMVKQADKARCCLPAHLPAVACLAHGQSSAGCSLACALYRFRVVYLRKLVHPAFRAFDVEEQKVRTADRTLLTLMRWEHGHQVVLGRIGLWRLESALRIIGPTENLH